MGEVLFKRLFVGFLLVVGLFFAMYAAKDSEISFEESITGMATHPVYPSFSSAESGFVFNNNSNSVSVSDTIVYRIGYYSVNGSAWQSFNLSGAFYPSSTSWLASSVTATLPGFGVGEHYIIIYSCSYVNNSWDCHENKWQLIVISNANSSSSDCSCSVGEYCSNNVCLLNVSGHTYFVATNGSDSNPGTFSQPWKTWGKAFSHSALTGGDIVYFRGGTYPMSITNGDGYRTIKSGSVGNDVNYFNYPGEVPVLDCSNVVPSGTLNFGIYAWATNVHFRGLTIKNVVQTAADVEVQGWSMGGINLIFENCVVHDCGGAGFWMANGNNVSYTNCDGYNNWDPLTTAKPGNDGYGFMNFNWVQYDGSTNGSVYYKNCRAWGNGDDGFAVTSDSPTEYDGCWSYNNGRLEGAGNGFKLGWDENNPAGQTNPHVKNCIATNNRASGITTNEDIAYYCSGKQVYNNLIYHNGYYPKSEYDSLVYGIKIYNTKDTDVHELLRIFRNNIVYDNQDGSFIAYPDSSRALCTHDHNTWDTNVTINDADFVSLDYNQLKAPRKADGSLPDITFGHLKENSDLIDKGVDVGLPYNGTAPDLGAFETNYSASSCGNGTCDVGENCSSCAADCGCKTGDYCSAEAGVCLLNVGTHNTYFVSPTGLDTNPGTFAQPWKTWGKAFNSPSVNPGDIVYFRGGVYYKNLSEGQDSWYYPYRTSGGGGYKISRMGTPGNLVHYFNYPGEFPILDCKNVVLSSGNQNYGVRSGADYCHIKGLTVRNVWQTSGAITEVAGFLISGTNLTIENCNAYNIDGACFEIEGGDNLRVINSDAWNCSDRLGDPDLPGNDGYGFFTNNPNNNKTTIYFENCRAWLCGDDGFAYYDIGYIENDNCWAFANGQLQGVGDGIKLGFYYNDPAPLMRKVANSILAYNRGAGITTNDNNGRSVSANLYNNLAYYNGYYTPSPPGQEFPGEGNPVYGFIIYNTAESDALELKRVARNNIAYANEGGDVSNGYYHDGLYTHSNNSWDSVPAITVSDADFVALPATAQEGFTLLSAQRKADGSLPDLGGYFHLAAGSDLINAGANVGLPYSGSAPDLGAFEYS